MIQERLIALFGYPLTHTLSPAMHNAAFMAQDQPFRYHALPCDPSHFTTAISAMRAFRFAGANITVPYKQEIVPMLDGLTERAALVGAVNTLYWQENRLMGDNTDIFALTELFGSIDLQLEGQSAVILGSGGAARAAAVALARAGVNELVVVGRRMEAVFSLINSLKDFYPNVFWAANTPMTLAFYDGIKRVRFVVNATPVGMYPNGHECPLSPALIANLSPQTIIYDLIYNPIETTLLRLAKERSLPTYNGLEMLLLQGGESYRLWTGQEPPVEVMRAALELRLLPQPV